jgi:hypothetical protein
VDIDLTRASISRNIQDALSGDSSVASQSCRVLGFLADHGRTDALVFLLGMLSYHRGDLKRLQPVVEALAHCFSPVVAEALFNEIARLPSSNQTRRYLNLVIETLSWFPNELVEDRFCSLADDRAFSPKMRVKFQEVVDKLLDSK